MSADLIARLITAGTPADLVAEVAMLAARAEAASAPDPVAERRRAWDREYRAEKRAAEKAALSGGSGGCRVDNADKVDGASSLDKEKSPRPPKEINLISGVSIAPAREADPDPGIVGEELGPESPPAGGSDGKPAAEALAAAEAEAARLAAEQEAERIRKRWKDMPPPPSVSDVQWRGFLDHRKARRQSLTFRAYQLLCGKLEVLAAAGWPPGDLIDLAVERGWLTVFEPKNERPPNGQQSRQNRPAEFTNPMAAAAARSVAQSAGEGRPDLGDPGY